MAQSFATLARALRERGHDAQAVTHFVNQLVFCMFADDVGLLPGQMFTRMLEQARRAPTLFVDQAGRAVSLSSPDGAPRRGASGVQPSTEYEVARAAPI